MFEKLFRIILFDINFTVHGFKNFVFLKMSWDSFQVISLGKLDSKLFLVERLRQPFFFYCLGQFSYRNLYFLVFVIEIVIAKICDSNQIFFHLSWLIDFLHLLSVFRFIQFGRSFSILFFIIHNCKTVLYPTAFLKILFF